MKLSSCIWALTGPEHENLVAMADLGYRWIDIQPHMLASDEMKSLAEKRRLSVSSVAASFGLVDGEAFDSADTSERRAALARMETILAHGAALGASVAYVIPGKDDSREALAHYAASMALAAESAAKQGQTLCIEHFPGTALPSAAATLQFIQEIGHPNLYLLLDSGHLQMSNEDPAEIIAAAGSRLGYVHLDDNDGVGDLHWSLLDGVLTEESLARLFNALVAIGYDGAVSLELHPELPKPLDAQRRSRAIVLDVAGTHLGLGE